MGMFNVRKPRGFNHQYIYVEERKIGKNGRRCQA